MQAWQPDLIHSWDRTSSIYAHVAQFVGSTVPHVISRRTWTPAHALPLWIDRQVLHAAKAMITSSEILANEWRERGVPVDKLHVIPSGVREPAPCHSTRAELLVELGLPGNARLMGCIGRLTVEKRIKDVIWALDLIQVIREDVFLLIVGDGPYRAGSRSTASKSTNLTTCISWEFATTFHGCWPISTCWWRQGRPIYNRARCSKPWRRAFLLWLATRLDIGSCLQAMLPVIAVGDRDRAVAASACSTIPTSLPAWRLPRERVLREFGRAEPACSARGGLSPRAAKQLASLHALQVLDCGRNSCSGSSASGRPTVR